VHEPGQFDQAFGGLSAKEYHEWRATSELFRTIETQWFFDFFKSTNPKKILDFGCGTGVWIGRLVELFPNSRIVGIDHNPSMLKFAQTMYQDKAQFLLSDAATYAGTDPYDLIMSVLSADYIGFAGTARGVAANLSQFGVAYIFFLDPGRYPLCQNERVKSWVVSGKQIEVKMKNFEISAAKAEFIGKGLAVDDHTHIFRLADGIQRIAHCFESRKM
jgi:SAM-dependent methyltransferase